MSAGVSGGGEDDSDFELNLAPIIDCFTVLITYLLVSASFITLDMLQVSVATTSDVVPPSEQPLTDPPYSLSILVGMDGNFGLKVSGGPGNQEFNVPIKPALGGAWDYPTLQTQLQTVLRRYPMIKETSVKAEPEVQYQAIVAAVERIRPILPKVFLGE